MTYSEDLDLLAGHPHIARFRELCDTDPADPSEERRAYRQLVVDIPSGYVPAPKPSTTPQAPGPGLWQKLYRARACPYREPCRCAVAKCHHFQQLVTIQDCWACSRDGTVPPAPCKKK